MAANLAETLISLRAFCEEVSAILGSWINLPFRFGLFRPVRPGIPQISQHSTGDNIARALSLPSFLMPREPLPLFISASATHLSGPSCTLRSNRFHPAMGRNTPKYHHRGTTYPNRRCPVPISASSLLFLPLTPFLSIGSMRDSPIFRHPTKHITGSTFLS